MRTAGKKLLSLALAALLAVGTLPQTVFAMGETPPIGASGEITAFEPLADSVASQTVPLGTLLEYLDLPDTLTATVAIVEPATPSDSIQDSGDPAQTKDKPGTAAASVPVLEWVSEPEYDAQVIGTYTFTPVLDGVWSLADGVELPAITVQIIMGIMPLASTPNIIDLSDSDADLSSSANASGGKYSYDGTTKIVTIHSGPVTVTGSTTDRQVVINGTADVTLDNVDIDVSAISQAAAFLLEDGIDVALELKGHNLLKSGDDRAGLQVPDGAFLTINAIDNSQQLTSIGVAGAGIGGGVGGAGAGSCGTITINGGTITATGGSTAAGIGGDNESSGGTVIINGGTVTAMGQNGGAGIGSGRSTTTAVSGGAITINGGIVEASCQQGNAIGTGQISFSGSDTGSDITINGGSVKASSISATPTDCNGNTVYLGTLPNQSGVTSISVDEVPFYVDGNHNGDNSLYLYMTGEDHIVDVDLGGVVTQYEATWNNPGFTWDAGTPQTNPVSTSVSLSLSPNPVVYGSATSVIVTATVTDSSLGTRSLNMVDFYLDAATEPFASSPVISGVATTTLNISGLSAGDYQIKAAYGGSFGGAASDDTETLQIVVNAETPNITGHPASATYNQGDTATPLSVDANVSDGGTLSYQWYSNITNSTSGAIAVGTDSASYTPDTGTAGTLYYYCVVTNTNSEVSGVQTATVTSSIATVTVQSRSGSALNGKDSDDEPGTDNAPIVITTPAAQPNWPTIGSVSGKTAGTNTQRTFTMTDSLVKAALEKALAQAKAQNRTAYGVGIHLALDAPADAGLTLTLERAALNRLVSTGAKQFEIKGAPISLTLDAKALAELQKQSTGNVTITVKPVTVKGVRNAYDISFSYVKNGKTANITSLGSGTATLSIPCTPAKNEAVGGFYAVYVDGKGQVNRIADSSYDANSGSVMFATDHFSVYGIGYTAAPVKFTDISSHWAKESIDYAVSRGLLTGASEKTFAPNTAMTRAMLATALGKLSGVDTKAYPANRFTDVKADSAFRPYIEWASKKGIMPGVGGNRFAPDSAITREEMALIFSNYAKATGYTLPVTRTAVTFADASGIGGTCKKAVTALQQAGVIMGERGNRFNPKAKATRAEAAATLHRYIKLTIDPATAQGWAKNDDGQFLYYQDGKAVTGWQTIDGARYYFNPGGTLKTGWVQDGGNRRFYRGNSLLTGWRDIGAGA